MPNPTPRCTACPGYPLTIDPQSLYEYVLVGAPFANRTIFDEIELVNPDTLLCFHPKGVTSTQLARVPHDWWRARFGELLEFNLATLRRYFAMLVDALGVVRHRPVGLARRRAGQCFVHAEGIDTTGDQP